MKRYVIITAVFTALGHLLFFGALKADIKIPYQYTSAGLNIISSEQFDYIKGMGAKAGNVIAAEFPMLLSAKIPVWGASLNIVDENSALYNMDLLDESTDTADNKPYDFGGIYVSDMHADYTPSEYAPMLSDVFFADSTMGEKNIAGENTLLFNDGKIKLIYFVQGPAASRMLISDSSGQKNVNIYNYGLKGKFRFWVAKDGRINQVIVEEGTRFSIVDSEITRIIKAWHFNPVYIQSEPDYEWGVVSINISK